MAKLCYYGVLMFGALHLTRMTVALAGATFLARFGRPSLVRETSKISTRNYLALPYLYSRKFIRQVTASEADLLSGVILEKKLED